MIKQIFEWSFVCFAFLMILVVFKQNDMIDRLEQSNTALIESDSLCEIDDNLKDQIIEELVEGKNSAYWRGVYTEWKANNIKSAGQ